MSTVRTGNEPGSNETVTVLEDLQAFDALPRRIRAFLRECPYNFSASNVKRWYEKVRKDQGSFAEQIILDWKARAVEEQRRIEIREGRLPCFRHF